MHDTPTVRYLRPRTLAERWGCSLTTLWRLRQRGALPDPVRLSPGITGWRSDIIERIEAERAAVHDDARQTAGA